MPRGRKPKQSGVSTVEALKLESGRLSALTKDAENNLKALKAQQKEISNQIYEAELKEIRAIMDEKNISFEQVKQLLLNCTPEEKKEEESGETPEDANSKE